MNRYNIYIRCAVDDWDYIGDFDGDSEREAIQAAIDWHIDRIDNDIAERESIAEFYREADYRADFYMEF